jgi:methyl-accepting chemotaxis protein
MREVAQQVRRTTKEQAIGFGRMRDNVVGVREAIEQITGALAEQTGACDHVTESLGLVSQETQLNDEATEKIRDVLREFISQAVALRQDAERFRV